MRDRMNQQAALSSQLTLSRSAYHRRMMPATRKPRGEAVVTLSRQTCEEEVSEPD